MFSGLYDSYFSFFSSWAQVVGTFVGIGGVFLLYYLFMVDKSIVSKLKILLSIELKTEDEDYLKIIEELKIATEVEAINEIRCGIDLLIEKKSILINGLNNTDNKRFHRYLSGIQESFMKRKSIIRNYISSFFLGMISILLSLFAITIVQEDGLLICRLIYVTALFIGLLSIFDIYKIVKTSFK
jgi:hypothetical protein